MARWLQVLSEERTRSTRIGWWKFAVLILILFVLVVLWVVWSDMYIQMGKMAVLAGKYDNAKTQFQSALVLKRRKNEIYDALGVTALFVRDFESARKNFDEALTLTPKTVFDPKELCRIFIAKADYTACERYLAYLKKWQAEEPFITYYNGYILNARDNYLTAEKHFKKIQDDSEFKDLASRHLKLIEFKKEKMRVPRYYDRSGRPVTGESIVTGEPIIAGIEFLPLVGKASWENTLWNSFTYYDRPNKMHLTISLDIQHAAHEALGDANGAFVAIEPLTGALLAVVSHPTSWYPADPYPKNRAMFENIPPASIGKLFLAAKVLQDGANTQKWFPYQCSARLQVEGGAIACPSAHGKLDNLEDALATSCNTVFAKIAIDTEEEYIRDMWTNLALGVHIYISPFRDAPTGYVTTEARSPYALGRLAVGLDGVRLTPLYVASLIGGIANEGKMMKPYLVSKKANITDEIYEETMPAKWRDIMTAEVAKQIRDAMRSSVESPRGTARDLRIDGLPNAAKTGGFGDLAKGSAWVVGFAPCENPRIAYAILLEGSGVAQRKAVSRARVFLRKIKETGFFDNKTQQEVVK